MMYGTYGDGWGAGWMVLVPLGWLVLIALAVWAVVRLTGPDRGAPSNHRHGSIEDHPPVWPPHDHAHRESPEELVDRRFAAGEIGAEEHDRVRRQLAEHRGRGASR